MLSNKVVIRIDDDIEVSDARATDAVTIYDIARVAGVSPSSVSRALSQPGRLNAKTEGRILAVAAELGFQANPFARALPTGRTRLLGLLINDAANPVFAGAIRGAAEVASAHDYTLILTDSQSSAEDMTVVLRRLLPMVDGVISASGRVTPEELRQAAGPKPVVLVNRDAGGFDSVTPDILPGVEDAVLLLKSLGHHRVGFVQAPEYSWLGQHRYEAIKRKLAAMDFELVSLGRAEPTLDGGRTAAAKVLSSGISAVFTFNDLMAIGLMREAESLGVRVPDDLSVIGFDNIFGSDFTSPPLTTIATSLDDASRAATRILLQRLGESVKGDTAPPDLDGKLLVRGTVGAPRSRD